MGPSRVAPPSSFVVIKTKHGSGGSGGVTIGHSGGLLILASCILIFVFAGTFTALLPHYLMLFSLGPIPTASTRSALPT